MTEYGYTYDGSSEWSIGPKADPQANPICTVWDRNDDRAKTKVMLIVNALNANEKMRKLLKELNVLPNCFYCGRTKGMDHYIDCDLVKALTP